VRLSDDERVTSAVTASVRWRTLEHHETVGSTNDVVLAALRDGAAPGLVVVADRQTAGRGRAGRSWTDDVAGPHGPGNLAVTASLVAPAEAPGLVPLATGLAVADAFEEVGADPELKWPNDVLLDDRKAAGILVERHDLEVPVLLLGCGLDLDWRGVDREGDAAGWTSVAESIGDDVDRAEVLAALLRALDRHLGVLADDPPLLLERYSLRCATIGLEVHASLPGGATVTGTALGLDESGRLELDTGHELVAVTAGDVTHLRPA
jgi:BirA family biotin operon repressor/biotin-[acetyl-CoA-carboxylase] ligase